MPKINPNTLRKLNLYRQNPDIVQPLSNGELADLVVVVLGQVDIIDKAIKDGRLDGVTPIAGEDYLSKAEALKMLTNAVNTKLSEFDASTKVKGSTMEAQVTQAIANIRNGDNGVVTEEDIAKAAKMAMELIELPDFTTLVQTEITTDGVAVRDALELLNGEEKLSCEAIAGLEGKLADLQRMAISQTTGQAGGVSKHTVLALIAENAGGGTFLSLEDTPSDYTGDALKVVRVNATATALEFNTPTSGGNAQTGDPLSQFAATSLAQLNGVISDATLGTASDFATAAQGSTADSAVQNTGNETVAGVKTFSSSPIIPAPSTDLQAATKKYVDDNGGGTVDVLSNVATARIIGRTTAGSGNSEELTASATRTFLNVEDNADVTDTANVRSAGAVMDDELTSIANVKALNQSLVSGAAPNFTVANQTIDDTDLKVVDTTNLQTFVDGIDHAILKDRGTGVHATYTSSVTVGGTVFAQGAVFGEINSDEGYVDVHYTGATGITVSDLSASSTFVYLDKNGALQQQTSQPTRQDRTRKIFTMRIAVNTSTNQITNFEYLNNPIGHYTNSIRDLFEFLQAQGVPFRKGQLVTGRTDNLGFNIGSGSVLEFGGTGNIFNPNIIEFDAVSNASYFLFERTGTASTATNLVKSWDNAGTITALGSTTVVAHRLYRYSSGSVAIQYGQGNYANMTLAKAGSKLEEYVLNPRLVDATFFGWWLLEETATATSGTVDAEFVPYTIGVQGGASSTLAGALLSGNNLSDLLDAATARANMGVLAIANPTFTGEIGVGSVNVSETELGILEGATLSTAELNYVDGVTSSVQTQLDARSIVSEGSGTPATTPTKSGDIYTDTTANLTYLATGTASSSDWKVQAAGTAGTPGKGSLLVGNGADSFDELTAGTNDQIFVYDSGQTLGGKKVDLCSGINFIVDGGGSAVTTGVKGFVEIPFNCTVESVTALADQSGSIVVDIWKDTYANYPPVDGDSITASAPVTITSATKSQDTTLTGWTKTFIKGDVIGYNVDSITTCERVTISLKVRRNF